MLTLFQDIHITPGFYPITSICVAAALWGIYHTVIRMRCKSRIAQAFVTAGIMAVTGSLFFSPTLYIEEHSVWTETVMDEPFVTDTPTAMPIREASAPQPDEKMANGPEQQTAEPAQVPTRETIQENLTTAKDFALNHLWLIYGGGTLIFFIYLIMQIVWLNFVHKRSPLREHHQAFDVHRSIYPTPFSFARYIFMPTDTEHQKEEFILAHEASHIRNHHFYKLLLLQCLLAFNWFNPFVWMMIKVTKELQEMEADTDVLANGFDREQYQINLILTCTNEKEWLLAKSNYNYSSLKTRIIFMNKKIRNSHSRTAVGIAVIGFICAGTLISARTVTKAPATPTPAKSMLPRQVPTKAENARTAPDIAPANNAGPLPSIGETATANTATHEAPAPACAKRKYDGKGWWTMLCIGDSAYRTYKNENIYRHYKCFGKNYSLCVCIIPRNARDGRAALFTGAASTFKEKNNTTVIGAGVKSPRHWIDEDTFDDTWKDTYGISGLATGLWKTERWRRCEPSEKLTRSLKCFSEGKKRQDRLKGTWKCTASGKNGETTPARYIQYKVYGNDTYVTFRPTTREAENAFYTFSGTMGDLEFVNDNLILENNQDIRLTWIDENTYYEDYESNGETLREKWVRHDLPQDFQKILADIGY